MIYMLKAFSTLGMLAASGWFLLSPDFAAVLIGILSVSIFMMTFLPIATDHKV